MGTDKMKAGCVVHSCNPNYSRGGDQRIAVRGQPGEKPESWAWWYTYVIPCIWEA
jgi:hypothetical protein